MNTLNNRELKQIALNYSSDIYFKDYKSLQKMYLKTMFLSVIDTTLTSDNSLR